MYIHLMEMSPSPEAALLHGDRLVDLVPDSGHLVHMATHIDVLCGDYQNVVWRNLRAAAVDRKFFDHAGGENFYTIYRIHNLHFVIYGAMFQAGRTWRWPRPRRCARRCPSRSSASCPSSSRLHRHEAARPGPLRPLAGDPRRAASRGCRPLQLYTPPLTRYARTVALANLGRIAEAEAERDASCGARQRCRTTG
jgi:hypothetical protein